MAGSIDPRLTLFALPPVPLAVGCLFFLGKLVRRRFSQMQGLFSTFSGFVNESILGTKVINPSPVRRSAKPSPTRFPATSSRQT